MTTETAAPAIDVIREQLAKARDAKKCHPCGCFHSAVEALAASPLRDLLAADLSKSRDVFTAKKYDCLGCAECFPAIATNAVGETQSACPTDVRVERRGWPPLPGDYHVIRYGASVAVCTLNSSDLAARLAASAPEGLAIVGTMQTENLGIERVIRNVLGNQNLRFLILCGEDTQQAIGHLPGQSLESLFRQGIDERGRIRGARGKRPILRNVTAQQIATFIRQIELVPMIGIADETAIADTIGRLQEKRRAPFPEPAADQPVETLRGAEPANMTTDASGFFVIYPDRSRNRIFVEHYTNDGVLHEIVEGESAGAVYSTIIERNLVSRLDHAAYLGRELARVETALERNEPYVQDRAPERQASRDSCGCR